MLSRALVSDSRACALGLSIDQQFGAAAQQEKAKTESSRSKRGTAKHGEGVLKTIGSRLKTSSSRDASRKHKREEHGHLQKMHAQRRKEEQAPWLVRTLRSTDGAVIVGDAFIVSSTQLSSSLIPADEVTTYGALALVIWLTVASLRGDYTCFERISEEGSFLIGWLLYQGVLQGCFTWLFYTVLHIMLLSAAVSHGWLEAGPVLDIELGAKVSPILEVDVALLITMTAWRAFYYGRRENLF